MSMPATQQHYWTLEEVERLMDEREGYTPRYELVDGELLVTPSPNRRHQRILGDLYVLIRQYVQLHNLGEAVFSPSTVKLTTQSRLEPDLYVIPSVDGKRPRLLDPVTNLLLAAEVLSPSSAHHDRITKRRFFQKHRVPEYWVVDGEAETFEVWKAGDERAALIDDRLIWQPDDHVPPYELDVLRFFADVADE
jgi:Uma2 family endonuclease